MHRVAVGGGRAATVGVSGAVHGALEWGGEGGEWEGCACGEGVRGEGGGCRADSECEGCAELLAVERWGGGEGGWLLVNCEGTWKRFECVGEYVEGVSQWGSSAEFVSAEEVGEDVGGDDGGRVGAVVWRERCGGVCD